MFVPGRGCAELQQHLGLVADPGLARLGDDLGVCCICRIAANVQAGALLNLAGAKLNRCTSNACLERVDAGACGPRPRDSEGVLSLAPALIHDAAEDGPAQARRILRRGSCSPMKELHVRVVALASSPKRPQHAPSRAEEPGGFLRRSGLAVLPRRQQPEAALVADHLVDPRRAAQAPHARLGPAARAGRVLVQEVASSGQLHAVDLRRELQQHAALDLAPENHAGSIRR